MHTKKLAKVYKALSNENRLEIFMDILEHEKKTFEKRNCIVSQITEKFNIGAPTISHHLKELANADLIFTQKEGKYLTATVNKELLEELREKFEI